MIFCTNVLSIHLKYKANTKIILYTIRIPEYNIFSFFRIEAGLFGGNTFFLLAIFVKFYNFVVKNHCFL